MAYLFSHAVPIRRPISLQAPSLALQVYTRLEKSKVSSNRESGLALPLFTGQSDPKAQRPFGLYPRVNQLDSPTGHLEDTSHPLRVLEHWISCLTVHTNGLGMITVMGHSE